MVFNSFGLWSISGRYMTLTSHLVYFILITTSKNLTWINLKLGIRLYDISPRRSIKDGPIDLNCLISRLCMPESQGNPLPPHQCSPRARNESSQHRFRARCCQIASPQDWWKPMQEWAPVAALEIRVEIEKTWMVPRRLWDTLTGYNTSVEWASWMSPFIHSSIQSTTHDIEYEMQEKLKWV